MKAAERKAAKEKGLNRYFTGKPCKHGHVAERTTWDGACTECTRLHKSRRDKEYRERIKSDPERLAKHKKRESERGIVYRQQNAEKISKRNKTYRTSNLGKYAAYTQNRRTKQKKACPVWSDLSDIEKLYVEARRLTDLTGVPHRVDHVIPLAGQLAQGLHILSNLQIISFAANSSKINKFDTELYNQVFDPKIEKTLDQRNYEYTTCLLSHLTPSEIYPSLPLKTS